ncbi:MAG TPA: RteC domain-containing protein [Puia sp.]|jgi:hypothetical protein
MTNPFDTLLIQLERSLKAAEKTHQGAEKYLHGIGLIGDMITKLQSQRSKFIRNQPNEIVFFREVWPAFYARLFLYIRMYLIEMRRDILPADAWIGVIGEEEGRVTAFFQQEAEFWQEYRSGASGIDAQFTRAYSRGRILDRMAMVIDQEGATVASYRAACCLEMQGYGEWLREERGLLSAGSAAAGDRGYSFGGSDADLAEWLFGLQAVEAIHYKGQPADISRMQKWSRMAVGREVANIYDRGRVLRNRKKERLAFTKKTESALQKKWDQAEGKFD